MHKGAILSAFLTLFLFAQPSLSFSLEKIVDRRNFIGGTIASSSLIVGGFTPSAEALVS